MTDEGQTHWDIGEVGAVCHPECAVAQLQAVRRVCYAMAATMALIQEDHPGINYTDYLERSARLAQRMISEGKPLPWPTETEVQGQDAHTTASEPTNKGKQRK